MLRVLRHRDYARLFSAQFSLSHAAYLLAYPMAGFLGAAWGLPAAALALGVLSAAAWVCAVVLFPSSSPEAESAKMAS